MRQSDSLPVATLKCGGSSCCRENRGRMWGPFHTRIGHARLAVFEIDVTATVMLFSVIMLFSASVQMARRKSTWSKYGYCLSQNGV